MLLLPLLLLPLLLRAIAPLGPNDPPWRWGRELAAALACGVAVGLLCATWLPRYYLLDGAHLSSDFGEYCEAVVVTVRGELETYSHNRSMLPAWPSALLLKRLGLIDAMVAAGGLSVGAMGAGLYLWGRALHGRLAGVACALSAAAFMPMVLLSRTMSFYPEITAVFTLAAGAAAVACRVRTLPALAFGAGLGALCLLIDLRGLIFALPYLGLVVLAALAAPPRRWPVRLAVPALAVGLAWALAGQAYLPQTASLEGQVFLRQRLEDRGIPVPPALQELVPTAYVWGHSDPREIPWTLRNLQQQSAAAPEALRNSTAGNHNRARYLDPWQWPLAVAGLIAAIGILARPGRWRLAVLAGTCLPFAVSLRGAIDVQQSVLRFVATAEPWLAVLLGLGFATLAEGGPREGGTTLRSGLRTTLAAAALVLLLLGIIPSHLSPAASWRSLSAASDGEIRKIIKNVERNVPHISPVCTQQLREESWDGRAYKGSLYGGVPR